ncbi:hypothetical protein, partial [Stenotrophomonas sp.]|uniref:hypothetical protein n=1 Tax=Stenotrophomonas sp. TaxID=69392 RepID=UPI0028976D4E
LLRLGIVQRRQHGNGFVAHRCTSNACKYIVETLEGWQLAYTTAILAGSVSPRLDAAIGCGSGR